jgi:hypothetical protein
MSCFVLKSRRESGQVGVARASKLLDQGPSSFFKSQKGNAFISKTCTDDAGRDGNFIFGGG